MPLLSRISSSEILLLFAKGTNLRDVHDGNLHVMNVARGRVRKGRRRDEESQRSVVNRYRAHHAIISTGGHVLPRCKNVLSRQIKRTLRIVVNRCWLRIQPRCIFIRPFAVFSALSRKNSTTIWKLSAAKMHAEDTGCL